MASGPEGAERLLKWLREAEPGLELAVAPWGDLAEITGAAGWEPRRYVPLITRFHAEGGSRCLIGTRALLGEGWDAPAVNVVIDLTAATTPTSVVQARGRALRLDAGWPGKVADNWSVVCVTGDHPKGAADFDRFARKHDRYFALAQTGDVVSGVAHVDPRLSPYAPPPDAQFDALNATMLRRAGERDGARERWAIGTPFADEPVATVTVATRRPLGLPAKAAGSLIRPPRRGRRAAVALTLTLAAVILLVAASPAVAAAVVVAAIVLVGAVVVGRTALRVTAAPGSGSLDDLATAVADALHAAGLTGRDGNAVRVEAQADGGYRARLQEVPAAESALFAEALDEVLAPLSQPRYVIPRLILPPPAGPAAAAGLAVRRLVTGHVPATVVYHAVPTALSGNKKLAAGLRAGLERPRRPRFGGLCRLARGHRHPGRPARRRPVRPHDSDPHPVALVRIQRGEDAGVVVGGDDPEQAAGIGDHARGAGDGAGPGEGLARFGRAGRVAGDHGEAAQRQRRASSASTFRSARASRAVGGRERVAERPALLSLGTVQLEQGQPFEQVHGRFLRRVLQLPLHGRHGERRRRITQLEVGPRQPRPGSTAGSMSPVASAILTACPSSVTAWRASPDASQARPR